MHNPSAPTDASVLTAELKALAESQGFARVGIARAERLGEEGERLTAWLAAGKHGDMTWMETTRDVRIDPRDERMVPGARSVIVVAMPYARTAESVGPAPGRVARYARGRDYHNVLGKKLRKVAAALRERGFAARAAVDSMPVYERAWAQRAGLGFIGKNSCLIVPGLGSHLFLGAVVTTAELVAGEPMRERCGECTLCLTACPTKAFTGPRELDARRCISYLTIEQEGPIEPALRSAMGDWVFGCDDCQDICPFNRTAPLPAEATSAFAAHGRWLEVDAAALLTMEEGAFPQFAEGSPVKRAGRDGLARNAAIVLGNRGERRHLPVLREAARAHDSAVVREAAAWAADAIEAREPSI